MSQRRVKNMEEFAALSGLSRPTLSKFFNDPTSVRAKTREKIEAALELYDYRPNIYAVNQNRRLTRNIGIVVPYLADPFFAEISRMLEHACAEAGFNPILLSSHGDPKREQANLENLRSIKPAGVLLAPLGPRSDVGQISAFCEDFPTVLFDCEIAGVGDAYFGSNKAQSVALAVEYLCSTGEPPALFEMPKAPNPNADKIHDAYVDAMSNLGHTPLFLEADGETWEFEKVGYEEGRRMIDQRALPTNTVLCSNDRLAIGFLAGAFESGMRVGVGPGHALRVAGHDDHPYARYTCPSLTTVAQDYGAITGSSLAMLLSIIERGERPGGVERALYEGRLILRASA